MLRARNRGFSYALYLDSMNKRYIEEFSSCNVFILKVEECPIQFEELLDADEVFCTGATWRTISRINDCHLRVGSNRISCVIFHLIE
ncbi:branched-chain amino acid aminotransferase 1, mitochondrial-like [Olea europaea var. sylvestris]|uniref:branched-chain amino acid aminotransferase 1, mitochondrial-like n=1 Tax=Olea europaea var. sylvestris TaxID=158386 RepID=UPI000C1D845B|nr:branched-chain amino acid aminotransferase 1, mitochondrial-like [Olea europaea var. sylvestris]